MKHKIKSILRISIFFLIGIGCIWWFIGKLSESEINQLIEAFSNANYIWFVIAILINVLSHFIRALRWQQLIEPLGYKAKLTPTFLSVMSGYLANLAVPRLGEVLRCGLLSKNQKIPFEKTVGTVVTERAIDIILFLAILGLAFLLEFNIIKDYIYENLSNKVDINNIKQLFIIAVALFVIFIISLIFLRKRISHTKIYKKIKHMVLGLLEGMKTIFKLKNPLLFIFYSLFIWFLWILGTYVIFLCFAETSNLSFKIAVIATVLGAVGPMLTPGGIGIFPAIFAEALAIYKVIKPIGYAAGWLSWIVSQVGTIILGLFGFTYFSYKKHHETDRSNTR